MRPQAVALFRATFADRPTHAASAPGRVNLIGEHIDYNGGPVLPIAVAMRTCVVAGPADSGVLEIVSTRSAGAERIEWRAHLPSGWGRYLVGVMRELSVLNAAPPAGGARVAVASDVPVGAGLSSSAALAVAAAKALSLLAGAKLTPRQLAGVAYRAEHDHVGVKCGVMDQSISAMARAGHAMLLETASLSAKQIPFRGRLLLVDSGARHDLAASGYNRRVAECAAALERLRVELPELRWLAAWPPGWVGRLKKALPEPLRSRALHVVGETTRTRFAAQLLARGRQRDFGTLLYESHESLRRLYECSTPELDTIVAAAKRGGALGARLTGAGWGGMTLVLVGRKDVREAIRRAFVRAHGREPAVVEVRAGAGARAERV